MKVEERMMKNGGGKMKDKGLMIDKQTFVIVESLLRLIQNVNLHI